VIMWCRYGCRICLHDFSLTVYRGYWCWILSAFSMCTSLEFYGTRKLLRMQKTFGTKVNSVVCRQQRHCVLNHPVVLRCLPVYWNYLRGCLLDVAVTGN
jgi:hypothetical protein